MTEHDEALVHVMNCKQCYEFVAYYIRAESAGKAGSVTSDKKKEAAKLNGAKGRRPKKTTT
jgi:hypothetical protein